jgi:hypothetical protein
MATGYTWKRANSTYHGLENPDCPEGQGAGSVISSVNDFIKFVKAFMMKSFTLEMTDPAPWPSGQSGFSNP